MFCLLLYKLKLLHILFAQKEKKLFCILLTFTQTINDNPTQDHQRYGYRLYVDIIGGGKMSSIKVANMELI